MPTDLGDAEMAMQKLKGNGRWGLLEPDTGSKVSGRERARMKSKAQDLLNEGWTVYVSPEMARADVKAAQDIFARRVKYDTKGVLRGEIRGYDAEGDPPTSGDMRDTWAMTLVDPKTNQVVDYWQFAPLGDPDQNSDYESERATDMAREIEAGTLTEEKARKQMKDLMQSDAENAGSSEVEMILDSLGFAEMFPKYKEWAETHRDRFKNAASLMPRRPVRQWAPRAFKRPVAVRPYWRRGMKTYVEQHQREHPRKA